MKNKTALLITPEGEQKEVQPKNGKDFKLEELYELVCPGDNRPMIELVGKDKQGRNYWVHEEGKLRDLKVNRLASGLCFERLGLLNDYIVGNLLVTEKGMVK